MQYIPLNIITSENEYYCASLILIGYEMDVHIIFLSFAQNHRLWVLVRAPTIYVLSRNMKKYQRFLSENFKFLEVKFSIYLNRRVFVMSFAPN